MSKPSITNITLRANEELIKRTKQKQRRNFYMVGKESWTNMAEKGKPANWQYTGIDFIDTFAAMSKNEQSIIRYIKDSIKWDKENNTFNYIVELKPDSIHFNPELDDTIKYETFLKGFQLLYKKDLVRRTSRHHYMMNPDFFIITGEQTAYFERVWAESKPHSSLQPTFK